MLLHWQDVSIGKAGVLTASFRKSIPRARTFCKILLVLQDLCMQYSTCPDLIYTRPDLIYTRPDLIYTRPDLIYARPDLIYARPDLIYARPDLIYTRPDLIYTSRNTGSMILPEFIFYLFNCLSTLIVLFARTISD